GGIARRSCQSAPDESSGGLGKTMDALRQPAPLVKRGDTGAPPGSDPGKLFQPCTRSLNRPRSLRVARGKDPRARKRRQTSSVLTGSQEPGPADEKKVTSVARAPRAPGSGGAR